MPVHTPDFHQEHCLNTQRSSACGTVCARCCDICPAQAIELDDEDIPRLNENRCTSCTACVHVCPVDAISHEKVDPVDIVKQASELVRRGKTSLYATCSAVANTSANLSVPCHGAWDPMLLACIAVEGIRTLHLNGIHQCDSCAVRHGSKIMLQTEKDYTLLNRALGLHLGISREKAAPPTEQAHHLAPEPDRREFFRSIFPTVARSAIKAITPLNQPGSIGDNSTRITAIHLPIRLRLFLRALPRLQANFTPVPSMPSLPLGAIQADANCTACGECVEQCPMQALDLKAFGTNRVLEFRPDACIGCRQCVDICPEHAIEALPTISLPVLLPRRTRPLVMVASDKKTKKEQPCQNR